MFDSDTDLAYPPDLKRFLNYVGETVHAGIAYSSGQDGTARRSQNFSLRAASTKAEVAPTRC
jgi:hypothetical protein